MASFAARTAAKRQLSVHNRRVEEVIVGLLRLKPSCTRWELATLLHENYGTICERVRSLELRGEVRPLHVQGALLKSESPLERGVIRDLKDTVDPMVEIAVRNKTTTSVVNYINGHYKIRTGLVVRHTGYTGLNPDRLQDPFRPPTTSEKQGIMQQNEHHLARLLAEFPKGDARDMLAKMVRVRVWKALSKYDPELVQPQHFVMLVARRAIYEQFAERAKAVGIKRIRTWNVKSARNGERTIELDSAQRSALDDAIRLNVEVMERFVQGQFTREESHDIVQNAIVNAYSGYNPAKHGDITKFLRGCVRFAEHDYCNRRIGEKWARLQIYYDAKSQTPHMQNRPRNTTSKAGSFLRLPVE